MKAAEAMRQLAAFAVQTQVGDLPEAVVEHAGRVLLDTAGVILGGSAAPEATALARRLARSGAGPSRILGHALTTTPLNAALVNGTAATWLDFDSGHRHPPGMPLLPAGHPPVHVVPAALAVADAHAASGEALLAALISGYEVGSRIGVACRVRAETHPHGTYPTVCAAVAAARLQGADADTMARVIDLAAGLTLLPSFENAYQGRTVRNAYAGVGAANGILAAGLATAGFTPEADAVGTIFGHISSDWLDPNLLVADLGRRFEITEGYIKPYPCCRYVHPAVEAAEILAAQGLPPAVEIEAVEVRTYDLAATLTEAAPATELAAKFSLPYTVASMLVRRSLGPGDFRPEAVTDPDVRAVATRVHIIADAQYTAMTPRCRPARVTVRTRDGTVRDHAVERSSGGPDAPWTEAQVRRKFLSLAAPVLGGARALAAADLVRGLRGLADSRELTALLQPAGPGPV